LGKSLRGRPIRAGRPSSPVRFLHVRLL